MHCPPRPTSADLQSARSAPCSSHVQSPGLKYVLVGGGLQNALIALALLHRNPDAHVTLVEQCERLGGNHTWCFHAGDVTEATFKWLAPLVMHRWPGYEVHFLRHSRHVPSAYCAVTSDRLNAVVSQRLADCRNARRLTARVGAVNSRSAVLDDGTVLWGDLVVDARGPLSRRCDVPTGYQKFVGLELEVEAGSAPLVPTLMDARVSQRDGFRFVYVLPLCQDRVLVEDTYYSESPELQRHTLEQRVFEYAAQQGWSARRVLRSESGVLPIPLGIAPPEPANSPLRAGYSGGFFHPTTGYSLPMAARLAEALCRHPVRGELDDALAQLLAHHRRQFRFCVMLNRLLFGAFEPDQRHQVLERFYRLPEPTIRRFYALQTTTLDRSRILCGRPPRGFSARRLLSGESVQ